VFLPALKVAVSAVDFKYLPVKRHSVTAEAARGGRVVRFCEISKSIQIRFLIFHVLTRTKIAFRALRSPLFDVLWKIRFPSPTPMIQRLAHIALCLLPLPFHTGSCCAVLGVRQKYRGSRLLQQFDSPRGKEHPPGFLLTVDELIYSQDRTT